MPRLRTVLLHTQPVLHARWNPVRKGNLALCCGNQSVYTWSDEWQGDSGEEEMAECIGVPASTSVLKSVSWPFTDPCRKIWDERYCLGSWWKGFDSFWKRPVLLRFWSAGRGWSCSVEILTSANNFYLSQDWTNHGARGASWFSIKQDIDCVYTIIAVTVVLGYLLGNVGSVLRWRASF